MSEFNLIRDYFSWPEQHASVKLSVGDDAAILSPTPGADLLISVDTSIAGRHFPHATPPDAIGHKSLAVNLSDMAAMGATPAWFTLALTLPDADQHWLQAFSNSLHRLAKAHGLSLIGGDTTRGALSITVQIAGTVPTRAALLRSGAKPGDQICVSGYLGDAAAGLACLQGRLKLDTTETQYCIHALNYPQPQIALGELLRDQASSCMDISDGLLADLQHILECSKVGATIDTGLLPLSPALTALPPEQARQFALSGGDDYQLLFTLPAHKTAPFIATAQRHNLSVTVIGEITDRAQELTVDNQPIKHSAGYNHFNPG